MQEGDREGGVGRGAGAGEGGHPEEGGFRCKGCSFGSRGAFIGGREQECGGYEYGKTNGTWSFGDLSGRLSMHGPMFVKQLSILRQVTLRVEPHTAIPHPI